MQIDFSKDRLILPDLISDSAIFQAGRPVRIWGYTGSREEIRVTIRDREGVSIRQATGFANQNSCKFVIEIPSVNTNSVPHTLIIETSSVTKEIKNVVFGDVWVMAGQSNMVMKVGEIETPEILEELMIGGVMQSDEKLLYDIASYGINDIKKASRMHQEIRFFCNFGKNDTSNAYSDNLIGKWVMADCENIKNFSAVGYEMLKSIYTKKKCPQGGIVIAVGGSSIMYWVKGASYFESKVLPLTYMNISGIVWYQGESDSLSTSPANKHYGEVLKGLINDYRKVWRQERIPFLIVQLPLSFLYADRPNGAALCNYEKIRMDQLDVYDTLKDQNVYLIPTLDCGPNGKERISIHFDDKIKIGQRLGAAALDIENANKDPARYTGARVVSMCNTNEQEILLKFKDVGEGLTTPDGEAPAGFYVENASSKYEPVKAQIISPGYIKLQISDRLGRLGDVKNVHYQMEMTDGYPFRETLPSGVKLFSKPNLVNSFGVPVISFSICFSPTE